MRQLSRQLIHTEAHMHRLSIRRTLRKLLSPEFVREVARGTGACKRWRKVDPFALVWTLMLGSMSGRVRRLSQLRRLLQRVTGITLEESSFYDRLSPQLSTMLSVLLEHVLQHCWGAGRAARGRLAEFADIMVTDSTVVRLHRLLASAFPGTRTHQGGGAALKAHVVFAVTGAGKQTVKLTPERRSDRRTLQLGPWVRGKLLLIDLGYFDYRLLARIHELGGYFIIRAKKSIDPIIVDCLRQHRGRSVPVIGQRLHSVIPSLHRSELDVQVAIDVRRRRYGGRRRTTQVFFRAVGVRDDARRDYHVYLTNIAPEQLEPTDIAATYALRWEVELLFREIKTYHRLAQLPSSKPHIVEALVKASLLCVAANRVLLRRLQRVLGEHFAERVPHQRWAALVGTCAEDFLLCVVAARSSRNTERDVERMLLHEAVDPNKRVRLLQAVEAGIHNYGPRRFHPGHRNSSARAA
jgi:IS4 transposase